MPRPPKPVLIHKLEGTYRKDRHASRLCVAGDGVGEPPEYLSEEAKQAWAEYSVDSQYAAVLASMNRMAFGHLCALEGKLRRSLAGGKAMPIKEQALLHSMRMQFGLTPASQAKIRLPEKPKENRFAALG